MSVFDIQNSINKSWKQSISCKNVEAFTFMVSTGCIIAAESAQAKPPANADLSTVPVGSFTGGTTATTVAALNQILLHDIDAFRSINKF